MSEVISNNWLPVSFNGRSLWIEAEVLAGQGSGPLAPEHHVKNGKLDYEHCFDDETYAHVYDGIISRFGAPIGTVADLTPRKDGAS